MTESQSTCASVEKRTGTDHGKLQKFYDMLDGGRYDDLEKSLNDFSRCAIGAKLGLEDMSDDDARCTVREYDRDMLDSGEDIHNWAYGLAYGASESGRAEYVEAVRSYLDDIAEHEIDHGRLAAARSKMEKARRPAATQSGGVLK